ncbi:PAS-domain containing protein [uncultured Pseudoteredinibacter sp.]|uniref:PAS-domain containing protein n=1 Tax=uncultured Pseudoteredinibacter sp. TaxID=1641701 RepID=UPI00261634B1|nr:PAS-domain containing protein [uncultured Pseudoteredinibacter sp.]
MLNPVDISILSIAYLLCLFAVAYIGDRASKAWLEKVKPWVIGLSLTIYCTAWSFYGTTSQAVYNGWWFPPTFIGAVLTLILAAPLVRKIIRISKQENSTSIADFLGSRYGRSRALSFSITIISVIALLPYISLQLKAIAGSFHTLSHTVSGAQSPTQPSLLQDTALYTAIALALFTILFGTRRIDRNEHHDGLMLAIAFESVLKLLVFLLLALVICFNYFDSPWQLWQEINSDGYVQQIVNSREQDQGFIAALVLGAAAILCLPRQFHALVVESRNEEDLKPAGRILFVYLLIFGVAILPIAYGGLLLLQGQGLSPEKFALLLPLQNGDSVLATLVYLGGLSAGSSMVIVACVAVSTMISNELIMPALYRSRWLAEQPDLSKALRLFRRLAIICLLALSYIYYRWLGSSEALGSIGLLSMALVAQFAPALIAALFWQARSARGVLGGLLLGFIIWAYTLLAPALALAGWIDSGFIENGPFSIELLRPQQLFAIDGLSPISNGVLWSLFFNCLAFIGLSLWDRRKETNLPQRLIHPQQLQRLASSFLGAEQAKLAMDQFYSQHPESERQQQWADDQAIEFVENLLSGVIGSVSANHIIRYAGQLNRPKLHSDLELLQETSQIFQFSRSTLQSSIDSISQGISVVDSNQQLVAWNQRYLELFDYPDKLIHVGRPVADLVRFNAERGQCGPGDVEEHIQKRMDYLAARQPYVFERQRADNTVLEIRGNPLPDGGYVTTYTDITDYRGALTELTEHKNLLEQKVAERTAELQRMNSLLAEADQNKTRFLAEAGHDLAQPLNAARLFTEALQQKLGNQEPILDRIGSAIQSSEYLISQLLNIAKLDSGAIQAKHSVFPANEVMQAACDSFQLSAERKGIQLRCQQSSAYIESDPKLLLRIIQNLVSNGVMYTASGKVLLGARRKSDELVFEVWDTGIGIPQESHESIFQEFTRLNAVNEEGSGLGLATVQRLCNLLKLPLSFQSSVGQGSIFRVAVPLAKASKHCNASTEPAPQEKIPTLHNRSQRSIYLIENESDTVDAMRLLLEQWGFGVNHLSSIEQVKSEASVELLIADYHLDQGETGLDWIVQIQRQQQNNLKAIIISADRTGTAKQQATAAGHYFLKKPVKPAALRALLDKISK